MRRQLYALGLIFAVVTILLGGGREATAQSGTPVVVSGQVLDFQQGFLFFTSGDGFRVSPHVSIVDYDTKNPTTQTIRPRAYARATFDAQGTIVRIELATHELPAEAAYASVKPFAVAASTPVPNPDLVGTPPPASSRSGRGVPAFHEAPNGRPVVVTFTVQVPPSTPFLDAVYISTDVSGWDARSMRMDRIDALHYRVVRNINSGTIFHYKYTRGTALSSERRQNGLEGDPRLLAVPNLDVENREDIVYHWGDESANGQTINPLAVPTPFNPIPFPGLPPGPRPTSTPPH
ncbi:MAG: hypothetical protein DLM50_08875 [Candidatus Meridianibacter frigidus]|nr:MAG: hypothetical protein DLM50_08875 [Candidatus Eremiobacteraeota bacterium]